MSDLLDKVTPAYIPTPITTIGTGGCIITSAITGEKKYAALTSALIADLQKKPKHIDY